MSSALAQAGKWDHRKWGGLSDPIHKSDTSDIVGEWACSEAFRRRKQAEARGEYRQHVGFKTAAGTAVHETLARILRKQSAWAPVLAGKPVSGDMLRAAIAEEMANEGRATEVRIGPKDNPEKLLEQRAQMVEGMFTTIGQYVAEPLLAEAGFICPFGDYWLEGHIDLIYRPTGLGPKSLAITDWKTGAQKPHQITLDHGFESGIYSTAVRHGAFVPEAVVRELRAADVIKDAHGFDPSEVAGICRAHNQRAAMHVALRAVGRRMADGVPLQTCAVTFGRFPDQIWLTHMADFVPYAKKSKKAVKRPEDIAFYGLTGPVEKHEVFAGDMRGPGWLPVRRGESDISRLSHLLRQLAGSTRLGRFAPVVGEKCSRCTFKTECLNDGYEARGADAKALKKALRNVDGDGGLDDFDLAD